MRFLCVAVLYLWLTKISGGRCHTLVTAGLGYYSAVHFLITGLVVLDRAPWIIGKSVETGQLPIWSWLVSRA